MPYSSANAVEIDRKLREDFRRRVKDFGISTETVDPVLAVLFRTFAQQIEALYAETGRIRLAVLDELIDGLGIAQRVSRPAQTVIRLEPGRDAQTLPAGVEFIGLAQTGERLTFRTDVPIQVSPARLALALIYQDNALQLPGSFDLPDQFQSARPSLDPVRVNLGANPALFLAIENLPECHLSGHSFFFELGTDSFALRDALEYEPWCLVGPQGELSSQGVLRVTTGNAGVRMLEWLVREDAVQDGSKDEGKGADAWPTLGTQAIELCPGFYGSRLFVLPSVPDDRRYLCRLPRNMEPPLARIFGREFSTLFAQPRAWLRIGLPAGVTNLATSIDSISLHAITASNVECVNQTIWFARQGTSIPISEEAGASRHLVAPLSVLGENGAAYLPASEPSPDARAGHYSIRNGRIELQPARQPGGEAEEYANVRIWVTSGSIGNKVGPGQIQGFANRKDAGDLRFVNPTSAAGGSTAEPVEDAHARFARAILSRDRVVTRQDLVASVRAYDRRILSAESRPALIRSNSGLRRVQHVTLVLNRDDFADPTSEVRVLEQDLQRYLQGCMLYDTQLSLSSRWN